MAKVFRCRNVGVDCDFAVSGDSEDELVQQAYDHACIVHHCKVLLPEIEARLRAGIHEEPDGDHRQQGLLSRLFGGRRPTAETQAR